jgi:hypothetical protein
MIQVKLNEIQQEHTNMSFGYASSMATSVHQRVFIVSIISISLVSFLLIVFGGAYIIFICRRRKSIQSSKQSSEIASIR